MSAITLRSKVDLDGIVRLKVPADFAAGSEVVVTVQPAKPILSQEEWRQFIEETSGCISDPAFRRYPEGEFDKRDDAF